jgi:hypothetical protein
MAKQRIANYVFLPGVSSNSNAYPNAYSLIEANETFIKNEAVAYINANITLDNASNLKPNAVTLLTNNKAFIIDEIIAWVAAQVSAAAIGSTWYGYTYSTASCRRDTGLLIDAYIYDIRYGGNEKTIDIAKNFWQGGVAQLISPTQEILGFAQIINLINNYILPKVLYVSQQSPVTSTQNVSGTASEAGVTTLITALGAIITAVIPGGLSTLPATTYSVKNYAGYVFDSTKCFRDIGYVIEAYLNDLRYGGNARTRFIASKFWHGDIPQLGGDRKPEITAQTFIRDLINNTILPQAVYSPLQVNQPRIILSGVTYEPASTARITSLSTSFISVLTNGLTSLPTLVNGPTTIKLQGKYTLNQLLLITNSTSNTILYNFSDSSAGATISYDSTGNSGVGDPYDDDFPAYRNTADYVTTITLEADTSTASVSDDIQIFTEAKEQRVRPYDYGTDAIERMRVAAPQSMLDADFEYGLQPTKWQAIGISRGYPSVYEIPGSDTAVISVTTDASAGTGGVGESLITITTQGAHGLLAGGPITIRSLANTITGFNRAEGTFIIINVTSTTSFQYYATAKVGTSNGQVLATTYTQLRKGAFYTGASIGVPTFSVVSNGVAGSFTTKFITSVNTDQLAVTGILPALGAPISGTGITSGTQVSGTVGPGGLVVTANLGLPVGIGDTVINVIDSTGILEGMALDNGSGTAVFVSSISGSDINLTQPVTAARSGSTQTYTNISGTNITPSGTGATFSVDRTDGLYANLQIVNGGNSYKVNNKIKILGSNLDGADGTNDIILKVASVIDVSSYTNVPFSTTNGLGITASFDITINGTNNYVVLLNNPGSLFVAGDDITINGSLLGGTNTVNDVTFNVATVTATYTAVPLSTTDSALGAGATFNVVRTGATYSVTVNNGGTNFQPGDSITILGSALGGVDAVNNLTFSVLTEIGLVIDTITGVTGTATGPGSIVTIDTIVGTGVIIVGRIATATILSGNSVIGERSYSGLSQDATNGIGAGATFNVATSAGSYVVTIVASGNDYLFGDTLTILGSVLGGVDVVNDLTITVTSATSAGGNILTFDSAGAPGTNDTTFTPLSGVNITTGTGASFDITRTGGLYTIVVPNLAGSIYSVNDTILITGTTLGGTNPANNLTVTVTSAGLTGDILGVSSSGTAVSGSAIEFWSAATLSDVTIAAIPDGTSISTAAIAVLQVAFASPHGLVPGSNMLIDITSGGTNHALAKGPFYVESVPSLTILRYTARAVGTIDTGTALQGIVYARPDSYFIHRPYDGGVQLGTGGPQHGVQAIRMSKKYIRYQSGKGINYCTGALFAPSYNLQALTADGTNIGSFITVTTDDVDHGCQVGGQIRIDGVETKGYNGTYIITDIINERVLKVQASTVLANTTAILTTNVAISVLKWHGATVRAGTFDDQNGLFFQYDGQNFAVGRRTSTFQLSGTVNVQKDTNLVTGSNTRFRDQIKAGDRITIKGMTHVVTTVTSNTTMTVTPDYRGASNAVQAKACLVQEFIIPQSEFNLDRLDGTGPSGYNVDLTKMQMIGMQWSWYAVGFIDFMLRGSDGNFIFFHRIRNSNVNTEAYMRSGNMPVRYEVINESGKSKLANSISATQTTLTLTDASSFPDEAGIVYIDNELIAFSGKSGNTLTGCTRGAPMVNFVGGAQRTFRAGSATTHEFNTGVILVSNTISPIISHWGSAMLTDGLFDEDRGYLFNYASTGIQVSTTKQTAFLIRLAPSVSNAIIGDLGDRELINRAQLLLKSIAVTSDAGTGGLVIEGVLNPQNYPIDPSAISWSGLAGSSAGGQPSFAQVAPGGSVSWAGGASVTTSTATTTAALTGNATVPNNALFAQALGSSILYVTKASWDTLGASTGFSVAAAETKYPAGTTVSTVTANPNPVATTLGLITGTATIPPSPFFKTGNASNILYFTQASWLALNGAIGTSIFSNDYPVGTTVSNVAGPAFAAGQSYYTITTSLNSNRTHNPVTTSLQTYYLQAFSSTTVTIYFNVVQTYAPYIIGDGITVTGHASTPAVAGSWTVTECSTSFVRFVISTPLNFNASSNGNVVNNNALAVVTFSLTGAAAIGAQTLNFTQASWAALPIGSAVVTNTVNDAGKFTAGTQIQTISALKTFAGVNYYSVTFNAALLATQAPSATVTFTNIAYYTILLSKAATSAISANATVAFTPAVISTNTSFLYFTQASWETLTTTYGATTGTEIVDPTKFPSGTKIASISSLSSFAGTAYYRVNFTQSSILSISAASTITFQFGLPPYAQPGETVFSFIAAPGSAQSLDLGELKELTNTTLGGRGTYPNGPDVLAINVYKTSGTAISTNVVIRWGEAQA